MTAKPCLLQRWSDSLVNVLQGRAYLPDLAASILGHQWQFGLHSCKVSGKCLVCVAVQYCSTIKRCFDLFQLIPSRLKQGAQLPVNRCRFVGCYLFLCSLNARLSFECWEYFVPVIFIRGMWCRLLLDSPQPNLYGEIIGLIFFSLSRSAALWRLRQVFCMLPGFTRRRYICTSCAPKLFPM